MNYEYLKLITLMLMFLVDRKFNKYMYVKYFFDKYIFSL